MNLDGWAGKRENGHFSLHLAVERFLAYRLDGQKTPEVSGNEIASAQPIIQQFKTEIELLIRDGQTVETTLATDPVSGRVTKVLVNLNILK